jgi:hypothetical protein
MQDQDDYLGMMGEYLIYKTLSVGVGFRSGGVRTLRTERKSGCENDR